MKKGYLWLFGLGLCLIALGWGMKPTSAANIDQVETAVSTAPHPNYSASSNMVQQQNGGECDIYAVDLLGAWVDAGAMEGSFPFTSLNDESCTGDFTTDVLPMFTEANIWFEGSQACTECHFDNSEDSRHEMDLGTHAGILAGADVLSEPPGVPVIIPGDWENSVLRARLRNNRMPPGWEFDIEETNRDGPLLEHDGGNVYAVELIAAWVDAGAPDGDFAWTDTDGGDHSGSFEADVLPLFTTPNAWFEGSQACVECHFDNSEDSRHEMDLSSYAGIMLGGDVLSEPPGVAVVLPGDWENSKLRARLRNNRMPPGWEFDIEETNRDGPIMTVGKINRATTAGAGCDIYAVDLIGAWVESGAMDGRFPFTSLNNESCTGDFTADVLPLFTTPDAWFEGSQACTECHFDNSEDSRHEMNLGSYAGIMLGGDVLSEPPGVAIVLPGDWENSKLRARLRNNRMPPGWEFDIEETNRDGPLLEHDGGNVYAVELIGAWVDAGAPDGDFAWTDTDGSDHTGSFANDVLPLFTEANAWFEGSQACTECHFDNSEDSRHEMDLGTYAGILAGADVLSEPPGVPVIMPGDWENSVLRARLRNNRMPPGWEFDIEETNRDGPIVNVGSVNITSTPGSDCDIYAVDLIGAWVDAGAAEGTFAFTSLNSEACIGDFSSDVLPLFTTADAWFAGSQACTECHFDNSEDSRHEMDMGTYAGILAGADVLSEPPGVPVIIPGDWENSVLRARLRNNRMPPGWEFDIEETNRDGPLLEHDGGNVYAVELIAAWVDAGAPDGDFAWTDTDGGDHSGSFESDVLPLFTTEDAWFEGSQACTECHFDNSEDSRHEMDLSSYAGIMLGGDVLSDPPGVAIVLPGDWENSKLRARLRNNRMPPGWEFDIEETNRDGPIVSVGTFANAPASSSCEVYAVDLIGAWVDAGSPELDAFNFTDSNGAACAGTFDTDVLPLFTEANAWFEGSQACTECHFDNSEDSRHEMDMGTYAGILAGADVLSDPPGVPVIIPGDWENSVLRARLRNNRMPPGWEFDIEETNRDGPLLEHDGGNVYAVELIAAWVDAGAPDGDFAWTDTDGGDHSGSFESDVLPLFTTEDAWFEGSQACTECHFDNSEDSRHEMDLSSYAGIMLGGDVLSDPPGVAIVLPGDWENSKLRARLRNNRMPPGWEFDIEETNRDGPMILAGYMTEGLGSAPVLVSTEATTEAAAEAPTITVPPIDEAAGTAPIPPEIPAPTITETVMEPSFRPMFLALFGLMTVVFGVAIGFSSAVQLRKPETKANKTDYARHVAFLLFAVLAVFSAGLAVHATITDTFTRTTTIREEVPLPINMAPEIPPIPEVRMEEWQAKIPPAYASLANPFVDDPAAVAAGKEVYDSHDCYECHGENLDGQGKFSEGLKPRPVNLTDPALMNLPFITDSYLFWRISEGGSQAPFYSAMPSWKAYLTEAERWQVIAYIRSQVGTQMSESDQAAVAIIEQAGCFACHRIESMGRGGKIGPGWDELGLVADSRVVGLSAEEYVRQSILEPQAFTVEGFETQANTMPADFGERLSPEEVDLLVDFLLDLSGDK